MPLSAFGTVLYSISSSMLPNSLSVARYAPLPSLTNSPFSAVQCFRASAVHSAIRFARSSGAIRSNSSGPAPLAWAAHPCQPVRSLPSNREVNPLGGLGSAASARPAQRSVRTTGRDRIGVILWREEVSFDHAHRDARWHFGRTVHPVRGLSEVRLLGTVNVAERLRVPVGEREPGALHLNHDLVAGAEAVANVGESELHGRRLARFKRLRLLEAVAELAAEDVPAD